MNTQPLKVWIKRTVTPWRWRWQDLRAGHPGDATINVLGDSHVRYFRHLQRVCPLERTRVRVFGVTGATAAGMVNPASKTRALPAIRHVLRRTPRTQSVLLSLGEVDVGFVVPMRCQRHGTAPDDELAKVADAYLTFVDEVIATGFERVMLATVPPPTIDDWSKWPGPVGHLRKQVTMSLPDRARLARRLNALLRERQGPRGYRFLDVESRFIDEDGLVRPELVSDRPGDLHLNNDGAAAIYRDALRREGYA